MVEMKIGMTLTLLLPKFLALSDDFMLLVHVLAPYAYDATLKCWCTSLILNRLNFKVMGLVYLIHLFIFSKQFCNY